MDDFAAGFFIIIALVLVGLIVAMLWLAVGHWALFLPALIWAVWAVGRGARHAADRWLR